MRSFLRFSVTRPSHWRLLNQIFSLPADLVLVLLLDVEHAVHELGNWSNFVPLLVDLVDRKRDVGPALDRQAPRLLAAAALPPPCLRQELRRDLSGRGRRCRGRPSRPRRPSRPSARASSSPFSSVAPTTFRIRIRSLRGCERTDGAHGGRGQGLLRLRAVTAVLDFVLQFFVLALSTAFRYRPERAMLGRISAPVCSSGAEQLGVAPHPGPLNEALGREGRPPSTPLGRTPSLTDAEPAGGKASPRRARPQSRPSVGDLREPRTLAPPRGGASL